MEDNPRATVHSRRQSILKEKSISLDPMGEKDKASKIDPEVLAKAQKIFDDMAADYPNFVMGLIKELEDLFRRYLDEPKARIETVERMTAIAHDMKGQGGTFGYPLITEIADGLNKLLRSEVDLNDIHLEVIKAHIDAMAIVMRDKISGDGGEIGIQLTSALRAVLEKLRS
ncbi:MAG: Hpt domain-containing protein [Sphingomonadales bacterium]|jgi:hypothetical protein